MKTKADSSMNKASNKMGGVITMMVAGLGMLGVLMTGSDAQGAVITSSNFSLGYGFTSAGGGTWNDTETAATNTPTTIGDFTFLPTMSGSTYSAHGPTFPLRVLSPGAAGESAGYASTFDISASWSGATPPDAAPVPNYQITLTITALKIWGRAWDGASNNSIAWSETTVGHTASSAYTLLPPGGPGGGVPGGYDPANFGQVVWDPVDYAVAGTNFTRSFINLETAPGNNGYDGFEVIGNVSLTYDVVPEPARVSLLLTGLGLIAARWFAARCLTSSCLISDHGPGPLRCAGSGGTVLRRGSVEWK